LYIPGHCVDSTGRVVAPGEEFYDGCNFCKCAEIGRVRRVYVLNCVVVVGGGGGCDEYNGED